MAKGSKVRSRLGIASSKTRDNVVLQCCVCGVTISNKKCSSDATSFLGFDSPRMRLFMKQTRLTLKQHQMAALGKMRLWVCKKHITSSSIPHAALSKGKRWRLNKKWWMDASCKGISIVLDQKSAMPKPQNPKKTLTRVASTPLATPVPAVPITTLLFDDGFVQQYSLNIFESVNELSEFVALYRAAILPLNNPVERKTVVDGIQKFLADQYDTDADASTSNVRYDGVRTRCF